MSECLSKKAAEGAAFEHLEIFGGSHIVEGKNSYTVKAGSKTLKRFTFDSKKRKRKSKSWSDL